MLYVKHSDFTYLNTVRYTYINGFWTIVTSVNENCVSNKSYIYNILFQNMYCICLNKLYIITVFIPSKYTLGIWTTIEIFHNKILFLYALYYFPRTIDHYTELE